MPLLSSLPIPSSARTLGYIRVSTEKQAGETRTSLADQARAIELTAERAGRQIEHVFVDAGASGATAEGRPQFMQLVTFCESHPQPKASPGLVLALNDSRWGRFEDPEESGYWRVRLGRAGWKVRFAEGDDVGDGIGRMVIRTIGAAQASEYRENIRRNTVRGRNSATAAGFYCGRPPFGYRRAVVFPQGRERVLENGVRKATDERVKLVPGPAEEVDAVRWMFDAYARKTHSLRQIGLELNQRSPRPGGWSLTTICQLLVNRTYLGEVWTGRRNGNAVRDRAEWTVNGSAHEAIVSVEIFDAVQRRFDAQTRVQGPPRKHLLSGLIVCGACGALFKGGGTAGQKQRQHYRFYRCGRSYDTRHTCPGRACVAAHLLEPAVIDTLASVIETPAVQAAVERAFARSIDKASAPASNVRASLETQRRDAERRRDRLVAAVESGSVMPGEAQARLATLRANIERLTAELEQARFAAAAVTPNTVERSAFLDIAKDFRSLAAKLPAPQLRRLIEPWIQRAVFDHNTRSLTLVIRRVPSASVSQSPTGAARNGEDDARPAPSDDPSAAHGIRSA